MKKILFPLVFFLFPILLPAQKGLSVGVDFTLQHTGFTSWTKYRPFNHIAIRPAFGVFMDYHFTKWMGIQSGLQLSFYTQKRAHYNNNFTYLAVPIHFKFNTPIRKKATGEIKKWAPSGSIGFNTLILSKAVHKTSEGKENMERFTGRFHFELTGGLGMKFRLNDHLFLENLAIATFGDPVNKLEYNSTQGTIVNMNFGLKTSLLYWLDSSL